MDIGEVPARHPTLLITDWDDISRLYCKRETRQEAVSLGGMEDLSRRQVWMAWVEDGPGGKL